MRAPLLLTLTEVADLLGCSVATVKRRLATGALPAFRDGRVIRVREDHLSRYIAERVQRQVGGEVPATRGRTLPPGTRLWD